MAQSTIFPLGIGNFSPFEFLMIHADARYDLSDSVAFLDRYIMIRRIQDYEFDFSSVVGIDTADSVGEQQSFG